MNVSDSWTYFVLGFSTFLFSSVNAKALTEAQFKATRLPYSVMAYSNKYAHEYGLDASKAIQLPKGLEAVRLTLYKKHYKGDPSKGWGTFDSYKCSTELYVGKGLDIWWPEKKAKLDKIPSLYAEMRSFVTTTHLRDYSHGRVGPTNYSSATYLAYNKAYSPLLNYAKLGVQCTSIPADPKFPYAVWIEKEGGPDIGNVNNDPLPSPKNFYQFNLPISLTKQFNQYVAYAAQAI